LLLTAPSPVDIVDFGKGDKDAATGVVRGDRFAASYT
jgi:hypothetical protein